MRFEFNVGDFVLDPFYHKGEDGVILSIKDGIIWVKFGTKTFRYHVDTETLRKK